MEKTIEEGELMKSVFSYSLLKEVLEASNIDDGEEAVMVTRMKVDPKHTTEFERILRLILKNTHKIGHVSTCVVKPPVNEHTYTSIVKYSSLRAMRQIYPTSVESGVDFYKLFAARDSLLLEPPTYQIEAGFGTWIESDGNTRPMRGDDPEDSNPVFRDVPRICCHDSCENPHGLNVRASFVAPHKNFQIFQPRYQRNNKKGGQKNLRCFPCCRNGRHVSSGFCGDSIRVHVAVSRVTQSGGIKICPITTSRPAVQAFARFLNLEGQHDDMVSGPQITPGQTIEKHEVMQFVRDRDHPMNPLFPGILRGAAMESTLQSAIFEFNAECKAWHYGWTAPRGQGLSGSDAQHVFEILFFKPINSYMFCLERLRSDPFSIFSSRRATHAAAPKGGLPLPEGEEMMSPYDRGQKRKRSYDPPSPSGSTVTSTSSMSPRSSIADDSSTPFTSALAHSSFVDNLSMPQQPDLQSIKTEHQQSPMPIVFGNMSTDIPMTGSAHPVLQTQNSIERDLHSGGFSLDMGLLGDEVTDLTNHSLFAADQQDHRFVSNEDLPWGELYSFFDSVPNTDEGNSSSDPQEEKRANPNISTLDQIAATITATTCPGAPDAILNFL